MEVLSLLAYAICWNSFLKYIKVGWAMPTLRLLSIIQEVIPRQNCLKLVLKQSPRYEDKYSSN